ncbi:MAG: TonB family protein [Chitinivibrionales bacterium]|nr:TonB family protein [Chitinivibrionales bacterium]
MMIAQRKLFIASAASILFLWTLCGKKDPDTQPVFIIDSDTITLGEAKTFVPDSSLAKLHIITAAARRTALSQPALPDLDTVKYNPVFSDLSQRLSLETGQEWSIPAGKYLFLSGKALLDKAANLLYPQAIFFSVDSQVNATVSFTETGKQVLLSKTDTVFSGDSINVGNDDQAFRSLLSFSLILHERAAAILNEFIRSETISTDSMAGVADMIKGLLADTTAAEPQPVKKVAARKKAPSQRALKYRDHASIKNSINKHIPNLKALYKKHLKSNAHMSGRVWVNFLVAPDGTVISAKLKKTSIREQAFLRPFLKYVRNIRFKQIPQQIGDMSFTFPFEFAPE